MLSDMAREVGVVMVSLPPHTTHRFQSLDWAFFGPFGKYYDAVLRMWMREHGKSPKFIIRTEKRHPFRMLLVASVVIYHIRVPRLRCCYGN